MAPMSGSQTRNKSALVNCLIRRVTGFVSISDLTRRRFFAWSGVPLEHISLVPNGYEPAVFFPTDKNEMLLERYGLRGKRVLLTVGCLSAQEQYKGHDEIIEVLPELAKEYPAIAYLVVGEGDDRTRLEAKAQANTVLITGSSIPPDGVTEFSLCGFKERAQDKLGITSRA